MTTQRTHQALQDAHEMLKPLADELLHSRTMTREQREDIGRKINAARAHITTAQLELERLPERQEVEG